MATIQLPSDFREFLRLLASRGVEYLLVGGYAVGYHGYPRATADLDIWVEATPSNAEKMEEVLREFGFDLPELRRELFLEQDRVIRMGEPPIRIEILTSLSGVEFAECFAARERAEIEGLQVNVIALEHLKANKKAAGRYQDLSDLEHLP
jgi:predicted nucleotidyltransferase